MWDEQFEEIVRKQLPLLDAGEPLAADLVLRDYGLDSMSTVELLAALESGYGVRFADDAMDMENFATPETIWRTLGKTIAAGS